VNGSESAPKEESKTARDNTVSPDLFLRKNSKETDHLSTASHGKLGRQLFAGQLVMKANHSHEDPTESAEPNCEEVSFGRSSPQENNLI